MIVLSLPFAALASLALACLGAVELAKPARWRILIGPSPPRFGLCLRALVAGQLTNALSPLRAGEAVRMGVLVAHGGPFVAGAGALAGAKALDVLCLAFVAGSVFGAAALARAPVNLAVALTLIAAAAIAAISGPRLYNLLTRFSLGRKLHLDALADVAATLRRPSTLLVVTITTLAVWLSGLAANWCVLAAAGASPTLDLTARMLVAGYLVGLVPAPPARLGVFEAAVAAALLSASVPFASALSVAVLLHALQIVELLVLLIPTAMQAARRVSPGRPLRLRADQ